MSPVHPKTGCTDRVEVDERPAFPTGKWAEWGDAKQGEIAGGMTLRDYFAAKAMAVVWANLDPDSVRDISITQTAKAAYMLADAMFKAREARNGK